MECLSIYCVVHPKCTSDLLLAVSETDNILHDCDIRIMHEKVDCGPMPNVMVALPNIRGALCSTPQSLADALYLTAVQ